MSLNGLDSPQVTEAFQSALNEPGGWLLLKYVSRDEVDVLSRGNGGFGEAATAVANYPDSSPLYGVILYRRRKVILKYVPEGTSRLLLARTTVHFQAVTDRFSPHDAVFNATTAADINESALSSTCSLHTATSVYSNSGSQRKQNLRDISEDVEDADRNRVSDSDFRTPPDHVGTPTHESVASQNPFGPRSDSLGALTKTLDHKLSTIASNDDITTQPAPPSRHGATTPKLSYDGESGQATPSGDAKDSYDEEERPTTSYGMQEPSQDSYRFAFPSFKAKAKLFPRPVKDERSKKPSSSGGARQKMPAGVRVMHRKQAEDPPKSPKRTTRSRQGSSSDLKKKKDGQNTPPVPPPPVSDTRTDSTTRKTQDGDDGQKASRKLPQPTNQNRTPQATDSLSIEKSTDNAQPVSSSAPVKLTPPPETPAIQNHETEVKQEPKPTVMSPERMRLLRALELRKQQLTENVDSKATNLIKTYSEVTDQAKADSAVGIDEGPQSVQQAQQSVSDLLGRSIGESTPSRTTTIPIGSGSTPLATPSANTAREAEFFFSTGSAQSRGRTHLEPLERQISPTTDDLGSLADEDFINELEQVKLQQATKVEVPPQSEQGRRKSTQILVKGSNPNLQAPTPTATTPTPNASPDERRDHGRQLSSMSRPSQDQLSITKRNVSTGISRRIQALAESSSRETSPHSPYRDDFPSEPSVPFLTARNLSMNNATPSASAFARPRPSRGDSRASSPNRSIFRAFRGTKSTKAASIYSDVSPPRKFETQTITARIVRKPELASIDSKMHAENIGPTDLQTTPTLFNGRQGTGSSNFLPMARPMTAATVRPASRESTFSSMTKVSWKNFGRRPKEPPPPALGRKSFSNTSLERVEEQMEDNKSNSSKTSRMLKRFSGLSGGGGGRKGSHDNRTDKSGDSKSSKNSATRPTPAGFPIGDLNVQFPDSLLWKRRWVEMDSSGFLVLTAAKSNERPQTAFVKRYRLIDFRAPIVPSQDRQELPWSVVLDFKNGGTIQLACGDPLSQSSILKRLTDAHSGWSAYER